MANSFVPTDVYPIINEIAQQATGQKNLVVVNTATFTTVGETLLRVSPENTLNAISTVIGRTIFSVRPYEGKLQSLRRAQERWGAITRKIVNLYSETEQSNDFNTDRAGNQLDDGNSIDMYKIRKPKVMQLNFIGTKVLQKSITRFRSQLDVAFHSEQEFADFVNAYMTEFNNEIELVNEEKTRLALINFITGIIEMNTGPSATRPGNVVDLLAGFNAYNGGSSLTVEDVLSPEHIEAFMQYASAQIKLYSSYLTDMSANYHANIVGYAPILRHTPKARQRMIMYAPFFEQAKATVYSALFNPTYLDIGAFEGVNFWQSPKDRSRITAIPNILNMSNGESLTSSEQINHPYVLGVLFDEEAIGVVPQFDYASTTPFNSAGGYWNTFMHWRFNSYNDFTENAIVFTLGGADITPANTSR